MRQDILDERGRVVVSRLFSKAFSHHLFLNGNTCRYNVYKGARNTGKSICIIGYESLLKILSNPEKNILITRLNSNSNKQSTYENICGRIYDLGLERSFSMKENPTPEITYKPTGQKIIFKGLNDPTTLNSLTFANGYLTDIYIEEAFEIESYSDFRKLDGSLRGKTMDGRRIPLQITLCFNAWSKESWIYEKFFKGVFEDDEAYLDNPDNTYDDYYDPEWQGDFGKGLYLHTSTWKANDFRDKEITDPAALEMKKRSLDIYRTDYLGMWGNSTASTYTEFKDNCIMPLSTIREKYRRFSSFAIGIDTGLSNGEGGKRTVGRHQAVEERIKSATVMTLSAVTSDFESIVCLDEYYHTEIERNGSYNTDTPHQLGEPGLIKACADYIEKWFDKYSNSGMGIFEGQTISIYIDSADIGFRQMLELELRIRNFRNVDVYLSPKLSTQTRVDFEKVMFAWGNMVICDQCKNTIREFRNARRDKKGRAREDNDDHALTSFEYGFTPQLGDVRMWKQFKERK
jgi:phage terminase large subunit